MVAMPGQNSLQDRLRLGHYFLIGLDFGCIFSQFVIIRFLKKTVIGCSNKKPGSVWSLDAFLSPPP